MEGQQEGGGLMLFPKLERPQKELRKKIDVKSYCLRDRRRYKRSNLPCERGEGCPYNEPQHCNYIASKERFKDLKSKKSKKEGA